MEAKISLRYSTEREAKAVAEAVSPDNLKTPQGLKVITEQEGVMVITTIECELRLETFIATINDLLSCIQVAERALGAAKVYV
jgi:tRNA threonylcarbamoyladenosine modification (KEOPS) complex  Pcc1 subunit